MYQVVQNISLDKFMKDSLMKEYTMFHPAIVMSGFRILERNAVCLLRK